MLSIQQLINALRRLQNNTIAGGDLVKSVKHVALCANNTTETTTTIPTAKTYMTSLATSSMTVSRLPEQQQQTNTNSSCVSSTNDDTSSQLHLKQHNCQTSHNECFSFYSPLNVDGSKKTLCREETANANTQDSVLNHTPVITTKATTTALKTLCSHQLNHYHHHHQHLTQRTQRIQKFFQQQLFHHNFHTQHNQNLNTKQKQTQFAMSSLAAEPLTLQKPDDQNGKDCQRDSIDDESPTTPPSSSSSSSSAASCPDTNQQNSAKGKQCFNTGLADILQFMELIGNLKHTKRTGWVLRDVNDCESISGHMYRMSMLTFLLDGSEGLNQIRCMELALVHDLAESLVGDITPFCGVSKDEKKAMELKAMEDICKLIEPRGKRMMELFEEYEHGESPESRFVKDLDRLDMVMQAFEYEKRDNCLLKHQEFFDSTEGKFNHPFVKKLVNEIYEQREQLAKDKGATPPPKIIVPSMESAAQKAATTNGHSSKDDTIANSTETSKSS